MKTAQLEADKNELELYCSKPLSKDLHMKFKETAINYEISLELKSS